MADAQLAAVKALAAQAESGPAERQSVIASGAVPKLVKHLSSKTAAITSQSALALSLLASDPKTRPSVWEHQRALVPALVQTLKTGGPLTLARSLATLASLIKHIPKAGAAVVKANGVIPILRIAQAGSEGPRDAAVTALNSFHVSHVRRMPKPADEHTAAAFQRNVDLVEPLIRVLSDGPEGGKLFALSVLRLLPEEPKVLQALRRPTVTELLVGFAAAEDVDIAATSLEVLTFAFGRRDFPDEVPPDDAAYHASPTLSKLHEILPSRLQSTETALVKAASDYVCNMICTPGLADGPWLEECERNVQLLLQSPADVVKVQGMHLATHAWVMGITSEMEWCTGPVLPLIISLLDPRPQARLRGSFPDLRYCYLGNGAPDPVAARLASSTYAAAAAHAGDSPLPPTDVFISCAEVAETAGRLLTNLNAQPWGFQALAQRGFYTLAAALLDEKLLPLGALATLGRLFYCEAPENPQKLALAMQFLAADYVGYLFECIKDGEPKVVEIARRSVVRMADFVVKYAADPKFPTEKIMRALPCAFHGQNLLRAESYAALWPSLKAGARAMLTRVGDFDIFQNVGGVEWATTLIRHGPMHAKVGALNIMSTAVIAARRDGARVLLSSSALGVLVDTALLPPAELASQAAIRLCIHMTDYPSTYEIRRDSGAGSPRVPGSASHAPLQSEGSGMNASGHAEIDARFKASKARVELAQCASAAAGSAGSSNNHSVPSADASAGSSSNDSMPSADASAGRGLGALGHGGRTEAGSEPPDTPAELAPGIPAELVADMMAQMGGVRAAIAHFKTVSASPAPGDNCRSWVLTQGVVAKLLCRMSMAKGALPDLQDNGGLQLIVDLLRRGEEDERKEAQMVVAALALSDPSACAALQSLHAVTPLVSRLEDSSVEDTGQILLAVSALVRDGNGRQPAPAAVDDVLAAGAVPVLLRILALQSANAIPAFELLRLIACEPCGAAAIVAADYARPLVNALGLPSQPRLRNPSDAETPGMHADVLHMITKVVEERPEQGQALFAAGLAAQLATIFSSPLVMAERKIAMQLVEKLVRHIPGACDVLMAAGVFAEIHKLAVATPTSTHPSYVADIPGAEEQDPLADRSPEGVAEAETMGARALLCRLAGYRGGVLEIPTMDGEQIRYTSESATCQSQCSTSCLETPDGVQERPRARVRRATKRVCSMCGAVSEKDLRRCSGCKRTGYCNKECQKAHWPVHKRECRA